MVTLTLSLLLSFLELNFGEETVKPVQGFPVCICPLDKLNSSLGIQVSSLFLMCSTGITSRYLETLFIFPDWKLISISWVWNYDTLLPHSCPLSIFYLFFKFYPFYLLQYFLECTLFSLLFCSLHGDTLEDIK